jgi:apolipoprotein N-acyltransferase
MFSTPPSRRALWVSLGCAAAVLVIWTSFIIVACFSAARSLLPLGIAWLRFAFSGVLGELLSAAALGGLLCVSLGLAIGVRAAAPGRALAVAAAGQSAR